MLFHWFRKKINVNSKWFHRVWKKLILIPKYKWFYQFRLITRNLTSIYKKKDIKLYIHWNGSSKKKTCWEILFSKVSTPIFKMRHRLKQFTKRCRFLKRRFVENNISFVENVILILKKRYIFLKISPLKKRLVKKIIL